MAKRLGYHLGRKVKGQQLVPRPYESECVASLDYEIETQKMIINFMHRGVYAYYDVEPQTFSEINYAASRGQYFNLYVRGRYEYERIG